HHADVRCAGEGAETGDRGADLRVLRAGTGSICWAVDREDLLQADAAHWPRRFPSRLRNPRFHPADDASAPYPAAQILRVDGLPRLLLPLLLVRSTLGPRAAESHVPMGADI
ncbi:hypothetical protein LTR53_019716, partial [Teratosphaeriaceae sp. CCFEE 6253]